MEHWDLIWSYCTKIGSIWMCRTAGNPEDLNSWVLLVLLAVVLSSHIYEVNASLYCWWWWVSRVTFVEEQAIG